MYILFDIGGTKMRFARSADLRSFSKTIIKPTPNTYAPTIVEIKLILDELREGNKITAMVGGIAGVLSEDDNTLFASPNLAEFVKKPIVKDLERISGAKVKLFNDAELAGLGEATFGAGYDYDIVAYLTISTGIGGALIINKQIAKNKFGFEPGHQILNYKTGDTFEDLLGGNSLQEKYNLHPKQLPKDLYNGELANIATVGVHNVIQMWSPDVVVMGGSQMNDLSVDLIKENLDILNRMFPDTPDITLAKLGSENGLYGAMSIAKMMKK
ncbi:ROK family protein [Candidatus Nomurabacteria bacterium]|nr:ROK family protein [Candidatus Nomurabacteria bacterium]